MTEFDNEPMTRTIHINVTQRDIDYGIRGSASQCPLARAFQRTLNDRKITVGGYYVALGPPRSVLANVLLPPAISTFRQHFDLGIDVHPARFTMEIPDDRHR